MDIQTVGIDEVVPYAKNPRKNDAAVDKVAGSLKEFGWRQPIVVDAEMVVIAGHTRLAAARKLKLDQVPIHIATDLTANQIKAYRIADNRVSQEAKWDDDLLALELADLDLENYDLGLTGFDDDELAALMAEAVTEGLVDEDQVPPKPETPVTVLGDIWQLGRHRVMCGDSTSIDAVDELMQGVYPDLIHTDPPYGMNAVSKSGVLSKNYDSDILGDNDTSVAKNAFQLIYGLYPNSKHIWWGANYYSSALPDSECWLVWDKNNGESDQTDCELAWANFRSVVRQFTQASEKTNRVHPTQKPVSLMEWIIKRFKLNSTSIADFFGGSGSTLIAAEKNNINAYLMEFDPKYVDVIVKRWQDFTGLIAINEKTGKTFNEMNNGTDHVSA